jgi:hypothetical protein
MPRLLDGRLVWQHRKDSVVVEFKRKVELNGAEIAALVLDLESLTGNDLIELESSYRTLNKGKYIPVPDIEKGYQVLVAAFACKINPAVLQALPASEMNAICAAVRDFLLV